MSKLLAVGTLAYDAIETPFDRTEKTLGGSVSYIALAASHFNVDIGIVSVIGGDFEEKHLELLRSKNIDLSGVEKIQEGKTFFWSGRYHNDMNSRDTLVTELNTLADFDPKCLKTLKMLRCFFWATCIRLFNSACSTRCTSGPMWSFSIP
jgi:Sugar kinases, ribokinase family